nr:immunoglobulin light chain junction region [Macaca mulatta]MOY14863.1 immunoglobulin light chain junction region [Macaca mulatta]MOY15055.1 immunoglobulin light chain junction region [Macaca mulatta]MOY16972.1 immunoglobulin light chain junction region [Macaca mulatta]MOY17810.1 immunoglobulin light chain junction region [Macaca mulatta]
DYYCSSYVTGSTYIF